ncbi:MAG: hydroxyethylthiazole kinase [Candidatus Competibacterales bacterium]
MSPVDPTSPQPAPSWLAPTAQALTALVQRQPRIHCLTNTVAQTFSANVLLALGASPAMSADPDELEDFVAAAAALVVNLGTLDPTRRRAIERAVAVANDRGIPWVLDPVMVDTAPARRRFALALLDQRPQVVRANAREVAALGADVGGGAVHTLAERFATVVAQTGPVDVVTDGRRSLQVANGHPLMARITATGCAASAVVAAFLAVEDDPLQAAGHGLLSWGVAGEVASQGAPGPGTLQGRLLDALYNLAGPTLGHWGRLEAAPPPVPSTREDR